MKLVTKIFLAIALCFKLSLGFAMGITGIWGFLKFDELVKAMMEKYPSETRAAIEATTREYLIIFICLAVWAIICCVICIITISKLPKYKSRKEAIPLAVTNVIFGSLVAGILMLCISNEKYSIPMKTREK